MALPAKWKCRTCSEWHDGVPLCFGADAPAQWRILTEAEKRDSDLEKSLCVIRARGETSFFVRGHLYIPIHGSDEPFIWGVWASLSEKNFIRTNELWEEEGREREPAYFGWLCTAIPVYDDTMHLRTSVQTMPVGEVPTITVELNDHPLALDQQNGVSQEQVLEWAASLMHG